MNYDWSTVIHEATPPRKNFKKLVLLRTRAYIATAKEHCAPWQTEAMDK